MFEVLPHGHVVLKALIDEILRRVSDVYAAVECLGALFEKSGEILVGPEAEGNPLSGVVLFGVGRRPAEGRVAERGCRRRPRWFGRLRAPENRGHISAIVMV